jgi:excisionase family DNA binding protein
VVIRVIQSHQYSPLLIKCRRENRVTDSDATGIEPIFISVKQAAQALNISTFRCYQLLDEGVIASARDGRRRLVSVESVRRHAQALLSPEGDVA